MALELHRLDEGTCFVSIHQCENIYVYSVPVPVSLYYYLFLVPLYVFCRLTTRSFQKYLSGLLKLQELTFCIVSPLFEFFHFFICNFLLFLTLHLLLLRLVHFFNPLINSSVLPIA